MSTLASGGKVWSIPPKDSPLNPVPNNWYEFGKFVLFCLPLALAPIVVALLFNIRIYTVEETGHTSILGGYVEKYHSNMSLSVLILFAIVLVSGILTIRYCKASFPGEELAIPIFLILPVVIYLVSTAFSDAKDSSVNDWAKATYGYESVASLSNGYSSTIVEKKDGTEMQVGVLKVNDNFYLYENMTQLNELTTKLKTLEDA